jgi:hypothetical protein
VHQGVVDDQGGVASHPSPVGQDPRSGVQEHAVRAGVMIIGGVVVARRPGEPGHASEGCRTVELGQHDERLIEAHRVVGL